MAYHGWIHLLSLVHDHRIALYHLRMATKAPTSTRHTNRAASHEEGLRDDDSRQRRVAVAWNYP